MNSDELRIEMVRKHMSATDLCEKIGMIRPTFYRKMRVGGFDQGEMAAIKEALGLSMDDVERIFFDKNRA